MKKYSSRVCPLSPCIHQTILSQRVAYMSIGFVYKNKNKIRLKGYGRVKKKTLPSVFLLSRWYSLQSNSDKDEQQTQQPKGLLKKSKCGLTPLQKVGMLTDPRKETKWQYYGGHNLGKGQYYGWNRLENHQISLKYQYLQDINTCYYVAPCCLC
ncbi:hypothetical protein ABPG72_012128 [Tetrahymena utriculariae]